MSDSSRQTVNARWESGNSDVLTINGANGYGVAVGAGVAAVRADADGLIAVASITVKPPLAVGSSSALIIESFSMTEFQYASAPGRWFYAPQVRARAATGRRVSVLQLRFSIPGLLNAPPFGCGAAMTESPRDFNGEVYGDWAFTIDGAGQATGEPASATITFVDEAGTQATLVVRGPIVSGSLPTTYTGGQNGGACFHGYGSTG